MKFTFILGAAALLALFSMGCNKCEEVDLGIQDLNKAQALLSRGVSNPHNWRGVCDELAQMSDIFRVGADEMRAAARREYVGVGTGCAEVGYSEYCSGGWVRRGYFSTSGHEVDATFTRTPSASIASQAKYPNYYPRHTDWRWWYEPRTCRMIPVCHRFHKGGKIRPGYDQTMAVAYELDQVSGSIETACQRAFEGMPPEEITPAATEALMRIQHHAGPGMRNLSFAMGCAAKRGR